VTATEPLSSKERVFGIVPQQRPSLLASQFWLSADMPQYLIDSRHVGLQVDEILRATKYFIFFLFPPLVCLQAERVLSILRAGPPARRHDRYENMQQTAVTQ
jgi:hypothetical protein